ncbi:hypothetical protein OIU78_004147 [Salix suchowensis]|nr:hypothetical protein OIU78_004147 [Salix suchowensis]
MKLVLIKLLTSHQNHQEEEEEEEGRRMLQERNLKEYGSWAVITGATDGIGKAFAHQLAQKGLNLVLVSRNPNKLRTVSSEILAEHPGIKIKAVPLDFSSNLSARAAQGVIAMAVEGLGVGLLINNVGITYPAAQVFPRGG